MNKTFCSKIYVTATLVIASVWLLSLPISENILLIIFLLAVSLLGIPHGALDAFLATRFKMTKKVSGLVGFFIAYITFTSISIYFWYLQPAIALSIFLLVSIYHFSQDWRNVMPSMMRIMLASIVICGPSIIYSNQVIEIFSLLQLSTAAASFIVMAMQAVFVTAALGFLLLLRNLHQDLELWKKVEILVLMSSAIALPPLLHFTLYFCLLHSYKHLLDIFKDAQSSVKQLLIFGLPIVAITFAGMYAGYLWLQPMSLEKGILQVVFIGLFGLTMSHMVVIHYWHKQLSV